MRWITDFLVRTAVSYFSGRNQQFNHEALLYVGSLLLRRLVFVTIGALAAAVLAIGGLFMTLVDLGNYMNAFGSMGLSYSGGIGLILIGASLISLYFVYRSPVRIKEHELEILRSSQQGSMGEMILSSLMEKLQGYLQPQQGMPGVPTSASHPGAPVAGSPIAGMGSNIHNSNPHFRPSGSMDLRGPGVSHSQENREWSAYSN